jgi:peroxiredoxin Q/BCP
MGARRYEDLEVWQLSRQFADRVAEVLRRQKASDDFDLYNQMRSASRSPCRNIAEGFGRFFPREFAPFVRIARGSLSEMGEHLRDAAAAGWLADDEFETLMRLRHRCLGAATNLHAYLSRAAKSRSDPQSPTTGTNRPSTQNPRTQNPRTPKPSTQEQNPAPRTLNPEPQVRYNQPMPLIDPGKKAPAFTLKDQHGTTHKLSQYAGRPVILYFYPKDDTPGCTAESCDFQARLPKFSKAGDAVILGISILDEKSKAKFANKHGLTFPLLADADHEVAEKYGVWQEKMRYGRKYWGIVRATYLIRADGKVAQRWDKVNVEGHADEVLGALTAP